MILIQCRYFGHLTIICQMKTFEKIAFSLVTLFGLMCFAVVVYGRSPVARDAIHHVVRAGAVWPMNVCSMAPGDPCTVAWLN